MDSILEIQNVFTRENYPPNEQTGKSDVPLEDIYQELAHRFPQGYRVEVTQAGTMQGQQGPECYVIVRVALPMSDGSAYTFAGAANGNLGFAGLLTVAIRNAFLRHAGMGTELYEQIEGQTYNGNGGNGNGIPGSPFGNGDQHNYPPAGNNGGGYNQNGYNQNGYNQNQNNGGSYNGNGGGGYNGGGYNGQNRGGQGNYGPWTGEVVIKSGQFQGLKWAQLPPDVLGNMAQKGNVLANKELARRNGG